MMIQGLGLCSHEGRLNRLGLFQHGEKKVVGTPHCVDLVLTWRLERGRL